MSLVIKTAAGDTVSVNNEMLFVVHESTKANDPVNYPDYSYVCDVYVDSTLVERLIARPDPTYKMGIFDVSRALQPYASYGFNASSNKVDYVPFVSYQVKFGEQYDGTLYTNVLIDVQRNAYKTYKEKPYTSTVVLVNSSGKASNMPSTVNWHKEAWQLFPYFSNVSGVPNFQLEHYGANGSSLGTISVSNADFTANRIRQFNIGTNFYSNANVTFAQFKDLGTDTELLQVNYLCSKHPVYTLVWLNPYGAYDSQSFGMVSKKTIELTKKEYQRLPWQINASGEVSYQANNVYYGGKKGYGAITMTRLQLTSHLLNAEEYDWLSELFKSPEVYIYLSDQSKFMPVTITDNSYEHRTYLNSRLTPLQMTVEFADPYNSQWL